MTISRIHVLVRLRHFSHNMILTCNCRKKSWKRSVETFFNTHNKPQPRHNMRQLFCCIYKYIEYKQYGSFPTLCFRSISKFCCKNNNFNAILCLIMFIQDEHKDIKIIFCARIFLYAFTLCQRLAVELSASTSVLIIIFSWFLNSSLNL